MIGKWSRVFDLKLHCKDLDGEYNLSNTKIRKGGKNILHSNILKTFPQLTIFCPLFSQQAKNYIRSLPKVPKKDLDVIFSKASSNGTWSSLFSTCLIHLLVLLGSVVLTVTCPCAPLQPCASWRRCCSWTPSGGWAPPRPWTCLSSASSETQRRRLRRSPMIRPWTTQTCRWTSGNVRGSGEDDLGLKLHLKSLKSQNTIYVIGRL